jgi:hypothetical protein
MKPVITILTIALLLSYITKAQPVDTLTNEKVIELYKAGFSKDILKSKIQNSVTKFDVSIDGLVALKKTGIPEDIINLMISAPNSVTKETTTVTNLEASNADTKLSSLESGIYYKNSSGEYAEVEPSVLTNTKTNHAAQLFISGLINAKTKATLSDKQSSSLIYETNPNFYFVFDTTIKNNLNSENNVWFGGTRSPKEFLLVRLEVDKNSREITIGKGNIVNSDFGIDEKSIIRFTSKKLSKGIYEIKAENPLETGEYCFMFAQGIKNGQSSKVFDFSIREAKGF